MKSLKSSSLDRAIIQIEPLEARIAPAAITVPITAQPETVAAGSALLLHAGQMLTTGGGTAGDPAGKVLLYVDQGDVLVFTTDLNHNHALDPNEITGISVDNGVRMAVFVNIYGDIVTNLADGTHGVLTDSDNNALTGPTSTNGHDGRVLTNARIDTIELRSLASTDFGGKLDVTSLTALTTYSIYGNIYAGGGFGNTSGTGGLIIDSSGQTTVQALYGGSGGEGNFIPGGTLVPQIGSIMVGTATSGQHFSFGITPNEAPDSSNPISPTNQPTIDVVGTLTTFLPLANQPGADINGVHSAGNSRFNLDTIQAGDGGFGARGGNVSNVIVAGDGAGGYSIIGGNGGQGLNGGTGGSILGFSDLGSVTGLITLKTGDGGRGLTGVGGDGGTLTFGALNAAANLHVNLGSGGDGFTGGGKGSSFTAGTFTIPEVSLPKPGTLVSSTRDLPATALNGGSPLTIQTYSSTPTISTTQIVDFNHDGFGDLVFTNTNPDQLGVVFGTGTGTFDLTKTIYLNAPSNPQAVVVADFNNDGVPDIAVASGTANSFGGISVFLSKFTDLNADGSYDSTEFQGFTQALQSVLPTLGDFGYLRSATAVSNLSAGDFNGDGVMDLAVDAIYYTGNGPEAHHVVLFMEGLQASKGTAGSPGTGQFSAEFGTGLATPQLHPFVDTGTGSIVMKPTVLSVDPANLLSKHDVLIEGTIGAGNPDNTIQILDASAISTTGIASTSKSLGKVDTNRTVGSDKVASEDATLKDLTAVDLNNDGNTDLVVVTKSPQDFLVTFQGNGTASGFTISSGGGDQAGIPLTGNAGIYGGTNIGAITTTDANQDGKFDQVALYDLGGNAETVHQLGFTGTPFDGTTVTTFANIGFSRPTAKNAAFVAFDLYTPDASSMQVAYGIEIPESGSPGLYDVQVAGQSFFSALIPYVDNAFDITAGNGGNSIIGAGGSGGVIGSLLAPVTQGSVPAEGIKITLPASSAYAGFVTLTGGNGGNGTTHGGNGGNVLGVFVDYAEGVTVTTSTIELIGGNGGAASNGTGGNGGALVHNHTNTGRILQAGNGGNGIIGGSGGSIIGNGLESFYDTRSVVITATAGVGGDGIKLGGDGGSITNFGTVFPPGSDGFLTYTAGNGGNAVSGKGGTGGSVISSSPISSTVDGNHLSGPIMVQAGDGGDGASGGNGGSIANFINKASTGDNPTLLTMLAGFGGDATTGKAGAGGSLSNIQVNASGKDNTPAGLSQYVRLLAADGGSSSGGKGGAGGSVVNVKSTATSSGIAVAAGAGGAGLTRGGTGGSVLNSSINAAAETGEKVLVIAGDGGNALGAQALNGVNGIAGNGGSIMNFQQPLSVNARVDLIAGNGGSTVNYGGSGDPAKNVHVGHGGSITGAVVTGINGGTLPNITGSIGNSDAVVPIKSYTDLNGDHVDDETMAEFVANTLRNDLTDDLTDALGNVGIVAGVQGQTKGGPASTNFNGSVRNIQALNIMSMVAGSVNSIAAIQTISKVSVGPIGILGADKAVGVDPATDSGAATGQLDYDQPDSNVPPTFTLQHTAPSVGWALVDGAIFANNLGSLTGARVFLAQATP
jgi:hypothetical protein